MTLFFIFACNALIAAEINIDISFCLRKVEYQPFYCNRQREYSG